VRRGRRWRSGHEDDGGTPNIRGLFQSAIRQNANRATCSRAKRSLQEEWAECTYGMSATRLKGHVLVECTYRPIRIDQIDFDKENPRINVTLKQYGDKLDDQRIRFALQTATEGSSSTSSYRSLKDSARAAREISVPIVVWPDGDRFVCIAGNTRLAIYNEFDGDKAPGNGTTIQCLVLGKSHPNRHRNHPRDRALGWRTRVARVRESPVPSLPAQRRVHGL